MRTKLSIYNGIIGVILKFITYFAGFIVRYYFARFFLNELLGLEGLFANVIGILSVADLGIGATISFSLYKPIYDGDEALVSSYMSILRKIYIIVGIVIMCISLAMLPFIGYMVTATSISVSYIRKSFMIYVFGVAVSYFFSYDRTIIFARQKNYIVLLIDAAAKIAASIAQICCIVFFKNYLLYLAMLVIGNVGANAIISVIARKQRFYDPNLKRMLTQEEKDTLIFKVKNVTITTLLSKGVFSTDNILISTLIGALDLARNSGYSMIVTAIETLTTTLLGGATASIGDLIAEGNYNKIRKCFAEYSFLYALTAGILFLLFYFLIQPFIVIWLGKSFLFDKQTVFVLSAGIYFYLIQQPLWTFLNTGGLFEYYKKKTFIQVLINLIASIVFGKFYGIIGIFLGTLLCYVYSWIVFAFIINKYLFCFSLRKYFVEHIKFSVIIIAFFVINSIFENIIQFGMLSKMIILFLLITIEFILLLAFVLRFNEYAELLKKILFRFIERKERKSSDE